MNPRIGLQTPIKIGMGQWLGRFYDDFYPDTAAAAEWAARGQALSMAFVPGRMVDAVEEMLSSWRNNNNSGKASTSAYLPVLLIAVAHDYTETPSEAGRPATDKTAVSLPGDAGQRSLRVRTMHADWRAQAVVVSPEPGTAASIIGQLSNWCIQQPRFSASYAFEGLASDWPVQVVGADRMAVPSPVGEQVSILTLDLTVRATMPMFYGPAAGQPTDGQAPPGFPVVKTVASGHDPRIRGTLTDAEWKAFVRISGAAEQSDAPGVVLHGIVDPSAPDFTPQP